MAVGTGKGERGGSLRGGMQMQLSRESLPLSGRFNGWESCYLHPEKGYVEEQFGAGGSLERGRCANIKSQGRASPPPGLLGGKVGTCHCHCQPALPKLDCFLLSFSLTWGQKQFSN